MARTRATRLDPPVDPGHDHVIGGDAAEMTLVEYGSYACRPCLAAHEVVSGLRNRFGDRMRYVFRHRPLTGSDDARRAAELAEYASIARNAFWAAHEALMDCGSSFAPGALDEISRALDLPPVDEQTAPMWRAAQQRVQADVDGARRSGALVTPTFFINGRRYEGAWDETSLADAMLGSLGHRIQAAALDFVRWGPSAGLLLLLASVAAVVLANLPIGPAFAALWETPIGLWFGGATIALPAIDWVNEGLLSVFFLVVGLEIKREFTVGHLASLRSAALPAAAAIGGIVLPALLYLVVAPERLHGGWGIPISTDTAFAVALIVLLGSRVPVELRVFLTATVIIDDLIAIAAIALFYSSEMSIHMLTAAAVTTGLLVVLNRSGIYRPLPYVVLGVVLWACLHGAGVHATLAGVLLAVVTPTLPPANLRALTAQAATTMLTEMGRRDEAVRRRGPSIATLRALDAIHERIESPADKLLRSVEPWSSYFVLPVFALANAGVAWTPDVLQGHGRLLLAVVLGLVVGKPLGILLAARLAVRAGIAEKPDAYSWRQLLGVGAIAGLGFTMSLFIASEALRDPADFTAAKVAIFAASLVAGSLGTIVLWRAHEETDSLEADARLSDAAA
ncbi:MAG: Na+/H+ antiporter NhaA [Thermodesulfobacteriota bacterium]